MFLLVEAILYLREYKNMKVKLHTPGNRLLSCWTGGNVISTLEIFKKMWVTREEWVEKGNKSIIHVKTI